RKHSRRKAQPASRFLGLNNFSGDCRSLKKATEVLRKIFFGNLMALDEESAAGVTDGAAIGALSAKTKSNLSTMDFLQRTALDAQLSSDKILAIARKYKSSVCYPQGHLGSSLNFIARMIAGGLPTRVYYATQGGFDTHAG